MALKNKYTVLAGYGPAAFQLPPIACGDYVHTREFGTEEKFYVRRMPRRAKHTGKYGLFYYDPKAHDQLVGVYNPPQRKIVRVVSYGSVVHEEQHIPGGWECVQKGIYQKEFDLFFSMERGGRVLKLLRCAWCGRVIETLGAFTHVTGKCGEASRAAQAGKTDPEAGVF